METNIRIIGKKNEGTWKFEDFGILSYGEIEHMIEENKEAPDCAIRAYNNDATLSTREKADFDAYEKQQITRRNTRNILLFLRKVAREQKNSE